MICAVFVVSCVSNRKPFGISSAIYDNIWLTTSENFLHAGMHLSAFYLNHVSFFLLTDISYMAFVERGTGACFHMTWQPANLQPYVNFIRKVYVLMVIGAGKIFQFTVGCCRLKIRVIQLGVIELLFFPLYKTCFGFRYDHIKPGGRGGGPPVDHANRASSAGASVLPSTGPGPPPVTTRITKKPIVLRDRGRLSLLSPCISVMWI